MDDSTITDAQCSCKAGISGECAHVLAVILKLTDWILAGLQDVPTQPACTSTPQQWDKPRGARIQSEPVSTMVVARSDNITRKKRPYTAVFIDNRNTQVLDTDVDLLSSMKGTPLGYLACKTAHTINTDQGPQAVGSSLSHQIPLIQPMIEPTSNVVPCGDLKFPCAPDIGNMDIVNDYRDRLKDVAVTQEDAIRIEQNTRDQTSSELWHRERKMRITASNFGRIMVRKAPVTQKLVDSIMNKKQFTSASTGYGIANEKVARNMYRKKTGNHVHDCGFIINPVFPCIGATPDGKVCDKGDVGILEIKCPFSVRDMKINEIVNPNNPKDDFFLKADGDNICLKRTHNHWFQVQGQLLITGAKFCDFVTFTRQDLHVVRILPHIETMEHILSKMCSVYSKFVNKENELPGSGTVSV